MRNDVGRIDSHIGELRERMGHVEGLLKGLRDVFVRRTRVRLGGATFLSPTGRGDFLVGDSGQTKSRADSQSPD